MIFAEVSIPNFQGAKLRTPLPTDFQDFERAATS
jgi:hypothetical protein